MKAIKKIHSELKEDDDLPNLNEPEVKRFSKLLMAKHKAVADHMNRGFGIKLQNIDSHITENILLRLTSKNIPVIPIHDSFIVQIKHEAELKRAMTEEYEKVIGKKPLFKQVY